MVKGQPGGKGYKAQNNTQSIFTDPDTISRFQSELIAEHMAARVQTAGNVLEGAHGFHGEYLLAFEVVVKRAFSAEYFPFR